MTFIKKKKYLSAKHHLPFSASIRCFSSAIVRVIRTYALFYRISTR